MDLYTKALPSLDLPAAVSRGLTRNDLLPARPDDKAGGEVAARFTASLTRQVENGSYVPSGAVYVPVPKANYATRLAALLTLSDRVMYYALADPLRERIEKALISTDQLLWPRATEAAKAWQQLEEAPLRNGGDYIVLADVSSFYESLDHDILATRLVELTGKTEVVDALHHFLDVVMGSKRGIPQGLDVSDVLATAYLSSVDSAMARSQWSYWRHGDDIRMIAGSHGSGRHALHLFETHLRDVALSLNGQKSRILKADTYRAHLGVLEDEKAQLRQAIAAAKEAHLANASDEEIELIVNQAGVDEETQWDLFYHGSLTLDDIIDQLRPVLAPSDAEIAGAIFDEAVARAPGRVDALADDLFHVYLSTSLTRLAAAEDPHAMSRISELVARFPDKTELLVTYLRSLSSRDPSGVAEQLDACIVDPYLFGWQQAWILDAARLVLKSGPIAMPEIQRAAERLHAEELAPWIARVAAMRFLCAVGTATHEMMAKVWAVTPRVLRADLAAGLCDLERLIDGTWVVQFLESMRDDAMLQVVINRFRKKAAL